MAKTRVIVAEDSLSVRKHLCAVLSADPDVEVIAEAENGQRALELCLKLRPDILTMDMMMPVMTGLRATERIMADCPTPILIVSSSTNRGELFKAYDALRAGAVDVLEKPRGDETDAAWEIEFVATVKLVARIRVITHLRGRRHESATPLETSGEFVGARREAFGVIAIGASTGGPGALVRVLGDMGKSPIPVLVVLHLGEAFASAFADWLGVQIGNRVVYATDGMMLAACRGGIVMAPPGSHLVVSAGHLRLTHERERHSCRPSVDVLFESIAREMGAASAACLLTGMGRDGAGGLLAIRSAGGLTIAQDEATSVVYGMPREAAMLGAAERILPIDAIGSLLASLPHDAGREP